MTEHNDTATESMNRPMTILVSGAFGQVGQRLTRVVA